MRRQETAMNAGGVISIASPSNTFAKFKRESHCSTPNEVLDLEFRGPILRGQTLRDSNKLFS